MNKIDFKSHYIIGPVQFLIEKSGLFDSWDDLALLWAAGTVYSDAITWPS